jgi:hypothetical protein
MGPEMFKTAALNDNDNGVTPHYIHRVCEC